MPPLPAPSPLPTLPSLSTSALAKDAAAAAGLPVRGGDVRAEQVPEAAAADLEVAPPLLTRPAQRDARAPTPPALASAARERTSAPVRSRERSPAWSPPPTAAHPYVARALASWNGTRAQPRIYGGSTTPGVCTLWWTAQPAAVPSAFIVCGKDIDTGETLEDLARVEAWRVGVTLRDARLAKGRRLDFYLLREASGALVATAAYPARQLCCCPAATIVVGRGLSPMMAATYDRLAARRSAERALARDTSQEFSLRSIRSDSYN